MEEIEENFIECFDAKDAPIAYCGESRRTLHAVVRVAALRLPAQVSWSWCCPVQLSTKADKEGSEVNAAVGKTQPAECQDATGRVRIHHKRASAFGLIGVYRLRMSPAPTSLRSTDGRVDLIRRRYRPESTEHLQHSRQRLCHLWSKTAKEVPYLGK